MTHITNTRELPWQYFSKLYEKWVDAKPTDCKESLKKYHYEIRDKPQLTASGGEEQTK